MRFPGESVRIKTDLKCPPVALRTSKAIASNVAILALLFGEIKLINYGLLVWPLVLHCFGVNLRM